MQTAELIADLEKGLAAAKELAAQGGESPADTPPEPEGSMMPGGVDSAPVSASEPPASGEITAIETHIAPLVSAAEPEPSSWIATTTDPEAAAAAEPGKLDIVTAAETGGLDLLDKLKEGHTVKEVTKFLDEHDYSTALKSVVKAISDLAQGVRI